MKTYDGGHGEITQTITPGARRAANIIMQDDVYILTTYGRKTTEELAKLIDDQTNAKGLLEACKEAMLHAQLLGSGQPSPYSNAEIIGMMSLAINKATNNP